MAHRSGRLPRPIGVIAVLATVCYPVDVVLQFFAPVFACVTSPVFWYR